jgi:hypothetical protein
MMIKRILTIGAAVAASVAGSSLAHAQQGYPIPPAPVYSASPGPYVPGGYVVDERRGVGVPDFDALEDDEAPYPQSSTAARPRAFAERSALWPSGLFRPWPADADRPDPFAG